MNYIKQTIIDLFNDEPVKLIQEVAGGLDSYCEYYSLINFNNIKYVLENFDKHSFFFIRGSEGSGKTTFQQIINNSLDNNTKVFRFDCSSVTELDDMFFAFYKFMLNNPIKRDIFRTNAYTSITGSIDEQIMSYLKHVSGQLVVEFRNFHKLLDGNLELKAENLKSFFEFLSTNKNLKVMFYSALNLNGTMDVPDEDVCQVQLSGLQEEQIKDFFAIFKCDVPQFLLPEIYEKTNGYLYSLRFLVSAIKILDLPATSILKEASAFNGDFNKFIAKKLIQKLSESEKKVLLYLALFRHEITENVLKSIDHFVNVSKDIEILKNYMLIDGEKYYELKTFLKDLLYESISPREKIKYHEKIADFYADQIPLKPSERVIEISRTGMYTEKFYHYNISTKLSKNFELQSSKATGGITKTPKQFNSQQIKYIASTKYFPDFDIKPVDESKKEETADKSDNVDGIKLTPEEQALLGDTSEADYDESDTASYSGMSDNYFGSSYSYSQADINFSNINSDFYENPDDIMSVQENDEIKKAKSLLEKGINVFRDGDFNEGIVYIKNSIALLQNKDDESYYSAKLTFAKALSEVYRFEEARNNIQDLMSCDISMPIKTDCLIELASIYANEKNYIESEKIYNKAITLAKENNLKGQLSQAYFKLALLLDDSNDTKNALYYYLLACESAQEIKNNIILAASYSNIASIYEEQNDLDKAIDYYNKSLQIDEAENNYEGQTKTLSCLGNIFFNKNETDTALKIFIKETKIAKQTDDTYMIASAFLELGDTFFAVKDYKNALRAFYLAKKNIDNTISTDSKNKIERRFDMLVAEIGENAYNFLLTELRNE